ncbi:hypothetical protein EAE92_23295 [Photorhabdus hainanensis]|nr:hypothetical protein [Photorhabdus hainanensis]
MNRNAFLELNLIFSHFHLPPHRLILSIRLWELNLSDNQEKLWHMVTMYNLYYIYPDIKDIQNPQKIITNK